MTYGMPYMGSKSQIAEWVVGNLPNANNLYDLFGGGGAITDCAAQSGKYKKIIYNDIDSTIVNGFLKAVNGKFAEEKRWISRDRFFKLKDSDPYVKMCFSFGNDGRSYSYGRKIEHYKEALHYAVVYGDLTQLQKLTSLNFSAILHESSMGGRMSVVRRILRDKCQEPSMTKTLQHITALQRLQNLEHLQRLQNCNIEVSNLDYRAINISPNSVIYCDIPYANTKKYTNGTDFDYKEFFQWCKIQTVPVYVSSYQISYPRFELVGEITKRELMNTVKTNKRIERLYRVQQ